MEHRFTSEHAVDGHAIEAADQLVVVPGLHAVGPTQFVEAHVRRDELVVDPTVWPVGVGTRAHHALEVGVEPHVESPATAAE